MMNTIIKIRHYVDENTLNEHEHEHDLIHMAKTHSKLYKMVTNKNCDLNMLYHFVTLQEKIQNGELKNEDADKQFGEVAAKRYVYPLVDNEK